jgi:two-component system sensor histidine kinase VicK
MGDSSEDKVTMVQGFDNIVQAVEDALNRTEQRWDACLDAATPRISAKMIGKAHQEARKRKVAIRYIIDITKDNVEYCKQIMANSGAEIRHSPGIQGSFGVSDDVYISSIRPIESNGHHVYGIQSTLKPIVEHHRSIFDTMWKTAIPGRLRIRELQEGISIPLLEVIENTRESLDLAYSKIMSAKSEVLIVFSTPNALRRNLPGKGLELLKTAVSHNVKVMLLIPNDVQLENEIKQLRLAIPQIEIRSIDESLKTRITIIVIDRTESFIFETKDDNAVTLDDALGESTHYNSGATSLSFASIFDSLWRQAGLYEKLKEMESMKDEFINIAAHELRTPVLPIVLCAENLEDSLPENENVKVILRNAKRMTKLAGDILDVSKIESKTFRLQKQKSNIVQLIEEAIQDARLKIPEGQQVDIIFESLLPPALEEMVIDKNRIRQVLENLLANAINFTNSGSIRVSVEKDAENQGFIRTSVTDSGKGIDPLIVDKLFGKFVSSSQKAKGTGLGLFLCKAIVEQHAGKIWGKNNIDVKGATFAFTLPYEAS